MSAFPTMAALCSFTLLACGHTANSDGNGSVAKPSSSAGEGQGAASNGNGAESSGAEASGGSAAGKSPTETGCQYGNETYAEGESFVDSDGCTTCECSGGGIACSREECPYCEYDGGRYQSGMVFPSTDGCNTCECQGDASVSCTQNPCSGFPSRESIAAQYPAALDAALACDPEGPETCTAAVPLGLGCMCEGFASADQSDAIAALKNLQQDYRRFFERECGSCAKPVSAYCGPGGLCVTQWNTGGIGCLVEGVVYADGSNFVPDPTSCNDCTCTHGELFCSQQDCEEPCPSGTTLGSDCVQHGDVDNCEVIEHACMPVK